MNSEVPPQAFRLVYCDEVTGAIIPLPKTAKIMPRFDNNSGEHIILWSDIKVATKNPLNVWHGDIAIPFHMSDKFEFVQPLRISAYPDIVLDVAVEAPWTEAIMESVKMNVSTPTISTSSTATLNDRSPPYSESTTGGAPHSTVVDGGFIKCVPKDHSKSAEINASRASESTSTASQFAPGIHNINGDFCDRAQPGAMQHQSSNSISVEKDKDARRLSGRDMIGDYERGLAFYEGKGVARDNLKALEWLLKAANQGYVNAQNKLAVMHKELRGVQQDCSEGIERYENAVNQGDSIARCVLGFMYMNGYGVEKDYSKAVGLYRVAASQGYASAQNNIGILYRNGSGVDQDYSIAIEYYRKAVSQGYAASQFNLGLLYFDGHGVPQDYSTAAEWIRKAADQGLSDAQFRIGVLYRNGLGVTRDRSKAVEWWWKAAEQGQTEAKLRLDKKDSCNIL
ncbi:hypothetical protein BGX27_011043 [Mortierella sp. AM989]|nr:hypothetical protein BGX27_011043 [Mortierella sp. AM989]